MCTKTVHVYQDGACVPRQCMCCRSITESTFRSTVEGPSLVFALAILVSAAYSFVTFIVAVVHFSDPLVDPSFNSKLRFLGFCLLVLQLPLVAVRIDFWMNVSRWRYLASQVILQVRIQRLRSL